MRPPARTQRSPIFWQVLLCCIATMRGVLLASVFACKDRTNANLLAGVSALYCKRVWCAASFCGCLQGQNYRQFSGRFFCAILLSCALCSAARTELRPIFWQVLLCCMASVCGVTMAGSVASNSRIPFPRIPKIFFGWVRDLGIQIVGIGNSGIHSFEIHRSLYSCRYIDGCIFRNF